MGMKKSKEQQSQVVEEKGGTKNCIQNVSESILSLSSTRTRSRFSLRSWQQSKWEEIMYSMKKVWSISFHATQHTQRRRTERASVLCSSCVSQKRTLIPIQCWSEASFAAARSTASSCLFTPLSLSLIHIHRIFIAFFIGWENIRPWT